MPSSHNAYGSDPIKAKQFAFIDGSHVRTYRRHAGVVCLTVPAPDGASPGVGYAGYARINAAPCGPTDDTQVSSA